MSGQLVDLEQVFLFDGRNLQSVRLAKLRESRYVIVTVMPGHGRRAGGGVCGWVLRFVCWQHAIKLRSSSLCASSWRGLRAQIHVNGGVRNDDGTPAGEVNRLCTRRLREGGFEVRRSTPRGKLAASRPPRPQCCVDASPGASERAEAS